MIKLAYCNVDNLDLKKSYKLLPKHRKSKVDFYKFEKDKKLSAGAYLLLNTLLREENIKNPTFKTRKYGKTYISSHDNIHFNLSHSGKMVACAISDREVGVDVEYVDREIDLDIAKHYFFNSEYENVIRSSNPSNEFFRYWVLKESYMKYTGLGFNLKLDEFEIMIGDEIKLKDDDNNLKFSLFDVENYKLATCSKNDVKKAVEYNIEDLF